jgi:hypothetical protein
MNQILDLLTGESKKVVFRLDTDKIIKLKIKAAQEQTTLNDLFNKAVDLLLKEDSSSKGKSQK